MKQILALLPVICLFLGCQPSNTEESDSEKYAPGESNTTGNMGVYELRTYYASEGNLENLLTRFRDHTTSLFEKHEMKNIGYWVPLENDQNILTYLLGYDSRDAREASWASFLEDVEWIDAKETSEINGSLVDSVKSVFLKPARLSPNLEINDNGPRVFELRTYYTHKGKLEYLHKRFQDHTMKIFENHGMTNIVYFNLDRDQKGAENTLVYIISHSSREAADNNWKAFLDDPEWNSAYQNSIKDGKLVDSLTSVFMTPTDFSPLK